MSKPNCAQFRSKNWQAVVNVQEPILSPCADCYLWIRLLVLFFILPFIFIIIVFSMGKLEISFIPVILIISVLHSLNTGMPADEEPKMHLEALDYLKCLPGLQTSWQRWGGGEGPFSSYFIFIYLFDSYSAFPNTLQFYFHPNLDSNIFSFIFIPVHNPSEKQPPQTVIRSRERTDVVRIVKGVLYPFSAEV